MISKNLIESERAREQYVAAQQILEWWRQEFDEYWQCPRQYGTSKGVTFLMQPIARILNEFRFDYIVL